MALALGIRRQTVADLIARVIIVSVRVNGGIRVSVVELDRLVRLGLDDLQAKVTKIPRGRKGQAEKAGPTILGFDPKAKAG